MASSVTRPLIVTADVLLRSVMFTSGLVLALLLSVTVRVKIAEDALASTLAVTESSLVSAPEIDS
jgi:hypothetical protein